MLLSHEQIHEQLKDLSGWKYEEGKIRKTYHLSSFSSASQAISKIAILVEQANHHPEVSIRDHSDLKVSLTTFSEGGVTDKDIKLVEEIEKAI